MALSSIGCPCCHFSPACFLPRDGSERGEAADRWTSSTPVCVSVLSGAAVEDGPVEDGPVEDGPVEAAAAYRMIQGLHLVDTHCHAHLERRDQDAMYQTPPYDTSSRTASWRDEQEEGLVGTKSAANYNETTATTSTTDDITVLSCSVAVSDWDDCIAFASQSGRRVAALGVHPWYCESLPESWLADLERLVQQHPGCLVGEIGLCKVARWVRKHEAGKQVALDHQRRVFAQQLELAARYDRPVSIHCVSLHRVLLDVLLAQPRLPPRIAFHSFTGTAHHVRQLQTKIHGSELYFGFSHLVNHAMCTSDKERRQGREAVRAVPPDRILVESDVSRSDGVAVGTAGAVAYVAWCLDEPMGEVAQRTCANGLQFLRRPFR
jgi:Tat protein secretion system quality control protein TatD with DNase activity